MKKKLRMPLKAVLISSCFLASLLGMHSPVSGHSLNSPPSVGVSAVVDITVSGKITDDANQPLPGVNILLKGTTTGTTSDADGNYTLTVPDENGVLVFSFIGYATQEVSISNRSVIDV
ncbi:MAG TPA: carboxypeptidase-like regulatory domain-containing protein, partial [Chryseolinea sp.]|nr:carboxypeptidase-like regulatory domain-containing protein [Chryseolinea sp.]